MFRATAFFPRRGPAGRARLESIAADGKGRTGVGGAGIWGDGSCAEQDYQQECREARWGASLIAVTMVVVVVVVAVGAFLTDYDVILQALHFGPIGVRC